MFDAVATIESKNALFTMRPEERSIQDVFAVNMFGLQPKIERIAFPAAGSLTFSIPTNNPQRPQVMQTLKGVILMHYPANGFWRSSYSGDSVEPDCYSEDGITGIGSPGGLCSVCPMNQYGSAINPQTKQPTKGKACKNTRPLYILLEGGFLPIRLDLPPTSLGNFRDYIQMGLMPLRRFTHEVVTEISLIMDTSGDGIKFTKAMFNIERELSFEECVKMAQMSEQLNRHRRNEKNSMGANSSDGVDIRPNDDALDIEQMVPPPERKNEMGFPDCA